MRYIESTAIHRRTYTTAMAYKKKTFRKTMKQENKTMIVNPNDRCAYQFQSQKSYSFYARARSELIFLLHSTEPQTKHRIITFSTTSSTQVHTVKQTKIKCIQQYNTYTTLHIQVKVKKLLISFHFFFLSFICLFIRYLPLLDVKLFFFKFDLLHVK